MAFFRSNPAKRGQPLLSSFLVVCLLLAGLAGISPSLHVWLDHAGQSAAHVHVVGGKATVHRGPATDESAEALAALLPGNVPIKLSARDLAQKPVPQEPQAPDHTHQSLSQLLLSGALENALPFFPPQPEPVATPALVSPYVSVFLSSDWNLQMASRGPPASSLT